MRSHAEQLQVAYEEQLGRAYHAEVEVERLREALRFYANPLIYEDWHDTGRTERQTSAIPTERWEKGAEGRYEYAGWDYEDQEFEAPLWLTTAQEDRGTVAAAALSEERPS